MLPRFCVVGGVESRLFAAVTARAARKLWNDVTAFLRQRLERWRWRALGVAGTSGGLLAVTTAGTVGLFRAATRARRAPPVRRYSTRHRDHDAGFVGFASVFIPSLLSIDFGDGRARQRARDKEVASLRYESGVCVGLQSVDSHLRIVPRATPACNMSRHRKKGNASRNRLSLGDVFVDSRRSGYRPVPQDPPRQPLTTVM
ncbi:hypothetical protein EYF80_046454 [Liparis tanakae]|uniref:Uncharacterized protein n=1 Tax=Liparis tanakae TaxID=230148 RepID=A0A4Z2FQ52_9TELE|nr:hypothetical protein EYF80_046454 [Liparis tanakae]